MTDFLVSVSREIRAPRAQVFGVASRVSAAAGWLWAPAQSADPASVRDMPDGSRRLVVRDGDKLRDWVDQAAEDGGRVVLRSRYEPRNEGVAGRHLRYELALEPAFGATRATLGLSFVEDGPSGELARRKWRRHAEQCLARLASMTEQDLDEADDA